MSDFWFNYKFVLGDVHKWCHKNLAWTPSTLMSLQGKSLTKTDFWPPLPLSQSLDPPPPSLRHHIWTSPYFSVKSIKDNFLYRNNTDSAELITNYEQSLALSDILPIEQRRYDKNRAPKFLGQPTVVYFHVTVLSIDSINEESMVRV